jgi:N-acetylmuramoyl-L-alanine amidase
LFPLKPTGPYGERLVIDLPYQDNSQPQVVSKIAPSSEDIIVAVDAGHGGEDPGAIGGRRTYEKDVTLQIAKRLAARINDEPGMKAVMVRSGDYFVNLNKRSEIARKHGAHILVSVHADGFTSPRPEGASVWVLSHKRANTEIGRWLESHEEQSELLGGTGEIIRNNNNERYLAHTLLDMSMDHSMNAGYEVSSDILEELRKITKLHKPQPEHASLAVLKSPDIPSVLVEAGFITNPHEEKLLASSSHQQQIAAAIFGGVKRYFMKKPPEGTLFAALKARKHVVRPGESLSVIASRYGISLVSLKQANQLSNNLLKIGQVLVIPTS